MTEQAKISIILPVYNAEKYLRKCLESLCLQSLKELEFICVNDGSQDASLEILQEFASKDSRFKVIDKKNEGAGVARNCGQAQAGGKYIGFIDADDWISKNFYESLYRRAEETGAEIAATGAVIQFWDNGEICLKEVGIGEHPDILKTAAQKGNVAVASGVIWNKIFRKDFLNKYELYSHTFRYPADDNYLNMLTLAAANQVATVNDAFYFYRQNPTALTKLAKTKAHYKMTEVYKQTLNDLQKLDLNPEDLQQWSKIVERRVEMDAAQFYLDMGEKDKKGFEKHLKKEFPQIKLIKHGSKGGFAAKLFSVRNVGYRKIVTFLGLKIKLKRKLQDVIPHINKKKKEREISCFSAWGLNKTPREKKVIVSLTSFPERIGEIHFTLYSLLKQSVKPDMVVLWLAEDEFPNREKDLPETVLRLRDNGLQIKWCENLRSYKKLIPALRSYPDEIIVTADDDIFYEQNWLETLYNSYLSDSASIHCHRSRRLKTDSEGNILNYGEWAEGHASLPSVFNFATGAGGVLYPPYSLYEDVARDDIFSRLAPYADDVWFWAMAVVNGTKIRQVRQCMSRLTYINPERELNVNGEFTLFSINKQPENGNDAQLGKVVEAYPKIKQILNTEKQYLEDNFLF